MQQKSVVGFDPRDTPYFQRGKNDTYVLSFQRALGTIIGIDLKKEGWIGTGLDAWKCSKEYFEIENVEKGLEQLF